LAELAAKPDPGAVNRPLPAAADTAIAAAIAALGLDCPRVTELPGGAANRSFRLSDARLDYVLRLAGKTTPGLGSSRKSEFAMQGIAAGAGLAPEIVIVDRDRDFIVTRYVDGRVPEVSEFRAAPLLGRVGAWIARLHSRAPPPGLEVIDFGERAAGYLARLRAPDERADIAAIAGELERRRAALPPVPRLSACHHDLHHRNFLVSRERIFAVDWEYAGPGDAAADLACCIGYHDLDGAQVDRLLDGYGNDAAEFRSRIEALGWIFDCLWFGWNAVAANSGLESDPDLQDRLAARLAR
jgi:aminoglycoside phosphotransferase (APT) family kinase protein